MKAEYVIGLVLLGWIVGFAMAELGAVSPRRSDRKRPPAAPSNPRKIW